MNTVNKIVFFDLETGGLKVEDPLIQLAAAVITVDWEEVDAFEAKIRVDEKACDPKSLEINSYDQEVWARDARDERDVISSFQQFLNRHATMRLISKRSGRPYTVCQIGGHGVVTFDVERLSRAFSRHQLFLPVQRVNVLDTLQGAAWYFQRLQLLLPAQRPEDFKLSTLAKFFKIDTTGAHDALVDVRLSIALARRFIS